MIVSLVFIRATAIRLTVILAILALLTGCGSSLRSARVSDASADAAASCPQTVMSTLDSVLQRVYREGINSERTLVAEHLIERSLPLRRAIESSSTAAARVAGSELLHTGHMTNLKVVAGGHTLLDLGGPALTPLNGTIKDASGREIATYQASVWADPGFASEASGVTQSYISVRSGTRTLGGNFSLGRATVANEGTVTRHGVVYQYVSFPATTYPSGSARIYLIRSISTITPLCGASAEDTTVNTLTRIARLIYEGETGPRTLVQIHRIEKDPGLLAAVAQRDPAATKVAVERLLHHHVVRLRVLAAGRLLVDDGGPYVLGPVHGTLHLHGQRIGGFLLSIQDDEGYLRLTGRLAGLKVLMYMGGPDHPKLVKNSLGPNPGTVPASGSYTYHGQNFRVWTLNASAFPSGPLTVRVLIPIPYS